MADEAACLTLHQSGLLQLLHDKFRVLGDSYGLWTVTRGQDARATIRWQDVRILLQRGLVMVFASPVPAVWYCWEVELTAAGIAHLETQSVKAPEAPPPPRNNEMTAAEVEARRRLVLKMYDAGERQMDIAETLGVSRSRTHQLLHTVLRERERQAARQIVMAKVAAMAVYERRADFLRSAERRAFAALGEVSVRRALAQWAKLGSHDNRGTPP